MTHLLGGRAVPPRQYVVGMTVFWMALASSGLLASIGCLVTRTLCPNIGPAAVALIVYLTEWPNGHAMWRGIGSSEDPEIYEEPR